MSLSPTIGISRLSLEGTPPRARSGRDIDMSRQGDDALEPQGEGDDSADEDNSSSIQSPTKLKYNIERLSPDAQRSVRSLWGDTFEEPPEISLQWCDRMLDVDGNDFYAFQMHEVVPRSVRIGSPKSKYAEPHCQCGAVKPCKHLVWLSDYIAQQALYDHDPRDPLTLNEQGYPDELGEPFQCISDMRLDVLADGLHCEVGNPLTLTGPSPQRLAEAQSIIASIADADEHVFDSYRADLLTLPASSLVHHRDVEATLFSLLVASHRLSAWLRSRLRPSDPARSPFRQIESRARRILADYDAFLAASSSSSSSSSPTSAIEPPCDAPWAATSLTRCARQVHVLVSHADAPLAQQERGNAARALVRILRGVVDRHNATDGRGEEVLSLYARLVGDRDEGFVSDSLEMLVDQSQFIDEIEDIMVDVGLRGAPAGWVSKMEAVVARMRGNRRGTGTSARGGGGSRGGGGGVSGGRAPSAAGTGRQQSRRRREESPALGPVEHGAPGSAAASGVGIGASGGGGGAGLGIGYGPGSSADARASAASSGVEFLVPETPVAGPSSSRGRGNGRGSRGGSSGGAGSKRSGAGESSSGRGSKRAR